MTTTQKTDPRGGVASRIREARRGARLTQRELAARLGVTTHAVWCWEAGRRTPSQERLAAIAVHCEQAAREPVRREAPRRRGRSPVRHMEVRNERMRLVIGAIARYRAERGYPPSLREVQHEAGLSSLSVVKYSLDWCEEAGLIVRARGIARAITLTERGRAFAEALPESGEPPLARREAPAPVAAGSAAAGDVATDAGRPACRPGRKTRVRPRADALTEQTAPGSGIAARIRDARCSAGLTQRELAALVGVSSHTVWCWEAGRTRPTWEHRFAVAAHCRMDVEELEGRTGPERDLLREVVAAFRGALVYLPEQDIRLIWTYVRFLRWKRRRRGRAA